MTRVALVVALAGAAACTAPEIPEGRFACSSPAECPTGWACVASRCRSRAEMDGSIDAASLDDAGARPDAPSPLDASRQDACVASASETCDGMDDDCDGRVDEAATCAAMGQVCESGACRCADGTFLCGGRCEPNAGCSRGTGSCRAEGVSICTPGGVVGCSVEARPRICEPHTSSACDPCGAGSAVGGTALCDADGCAREPCTPSSGTVFDQFAYAWDHPCGVAHDGGMQNWRCDSTPSRGPACVCAARALRLPGGTYRLRVDAGFPPAETPMRVAITSGGADLATRTFTVSGLMFTTHEFEFSLPSCRDVTVQIWHDDMRYEYVLNRIVLQRI